MIGLLRPFVAGFVSTLVFHQGLMLFLLWLTDSTRRAYDWTPMPPFGVPAVLSLAFWGGLWGIALWLLIRRLRGAAHWLAALLLGALLPSLVAWFVVMPLKGLPAAGGFESAIIIGALLLNGAWGLGVACLMRLSTRGFRPKFRGDSI